MRVQAYRVPPGCASNNLAFIFTERALQGGGRLEIVFSFRFLYKRPHYYAFCYFYLVLDVALRKFRTTLYSQHVM
eukprot:3791602-Pyramimonas_sp.AAC.1